MYSSGNIDVRNFLNHPVFCTVVRLLNGPFRSQSQYRTQHFSGAVTAVALPVLLRVSAPVTAHSLSVFTPNSRCCKIHATVKPLPKTVITNLRSGTSRQNHNTAERGHPANSKYYHFVEGLAQYHLQHTCTLEGGTRFTCLHRSTVACTLHHPF